LSERHNLALLEQCKADLRQVGGTLWLLQIPGAALIADEMPALCLSIISNTEAVPGGQLNAMSTAFFVLPGYLEFVQSRYSDVPLLALPHVNELRAAHNQLLLPDSYFAQADTWLFSRDSGLKLRNQPSQGEALTAMLKRVRHL
jgi:hypothetical protein